MKNVMHLNLFKNLRITERMTAHNGVIRRCLYRNVQAERKKRKERCGLSSPAYHLLVIIAGSLFLGMLLPFHVSASDDMVETSAVFPRSLFPARASREETAYAWEPKTTGHIVVSLKYNQPIGVYVNPKVIMGTHDDSQEFGRLGSGILLDGGIGTQGYKVGLGVGAFLFGYGKPYCTVAMMGGGIKFVYQQQYEHSQAEFGIELSLAMILGLDIGVYQSLDGDSVRVVVGGGLGF